jgi:tetratricopeptide (TPR) repeat protein
VLRFSLTPLLGILLFAPAGIAAAPRQTSPAAAQGGIGPLEQAVAARPGDVETWWKLAAAYTGAGRRTDAVAALRKVTDLAPRHSGAWYALGQAYNDIKQDALATFDRPEDEPWRRLIAADALLTRGPLPEAFALYRAAAEQLPSMVTIHDSVARIYERTGHAGWALEERGKGTLSGPSCATRKALCEFRAGRFHAALTAALAQPDAESRYWRVRAANELTIAAYARLDRLPDSPERRAVRATVASAEERYLDAVAELKAALGFHPGDPTLLFELASAYYAARDFEQALATYASLLRARPDDVQVLEQMGYALMQLQRPEEALPILQRAFERDPRNRTLRLALGRAHLQQGHFAEGIPLIEEQVAGDSDGSLHVQLARAYAALGQPEKAAVLLERSRDLQRADQTRSAASVKRTITGPK